jgi:hypothetical protein
LINSSIYESEKVRPQELSSPENTAKNMLFMDKLVEVHKYGMTPEEVGKKVLEGIRRNDLYIFSHPEFKEELKEIFDETLDALPVEDAPATRAEFEQGRRNGLKNLKSEANKIG